MNGEFRVGNWIVQRDLNLLTTEGASVQIEPKVMEVLVFLAGHPGEVIPRETILRAVWPDTHVTDEVLTYCISELRHALKDDARNPQIIQTIPRRGYRLIAAVSRPAHASPAEIVQEAVQERPVPEIPPLPAMPVTPPNARRWIYLGSTFVLVSFVFALSWFHPWSSALDVTDFILLTDFANSTGDPVFDGTLKHALAIHLSQSPFLNIYPEERARETLGYMGRHPDEPITRETGREICVRRGIKAMLVGSIAPLGKIYVISLEVINGHTGDVIAREQLEVESKEAILRNLGAVATGLRRKLGESMKSIGQFDVPLEQATTSSLDAFNSYSTGRKYLISGKMAEAIPHYRHALEFDPKFASAYDDLAWCYDALAQRDLAAECATKAFALRERVSQYEKLSIETIYYVMATGELDKAIETLEVMRTIYPRSAPVNNTLGSQYLMAGEYERAVESFREAIRLTRHPNAYTNLARAYLRLHRLQEAKELIAEARGLGIDNRDMRLVLYTIAFMQGDSVAMIEQMQWASGKPEEAFMLARQASAAALSGQLGTSREFYRKAIEAAKRYDLGDAAAEFYAEAGSWEVFLGNSREACTLARDALAGSRGWRVLARAAVVFARCGRADEAQTLADELAARYPTHSTIQKVSLPVVRATIALARGNAADALHEVGKPSGRLSKLSMWPGYLAGEAYLRLGAWSAAKGEFQKVLSQNGSETLSPVYPLARLGLARAVASMGGKDNGRKAYQDFFSSWKNADEDVPLFRLALAEYAGLK